MRNAKGMLRNGAQKKTKTTLKPWRYFKITKKVQGVCFLKSNYKGKTEQHSHLKIRLIYIYS